MTYRRTIYFYRIEAYGARNQIRDLISYFEKLKEKTVRNLIIKPYDRWRNLCLIEVDEVTNDTIKARIVKMRKEGLPQLYDLNRRRTGRIVLGPNQEVVEIAHFCIKKLNNGFTLTLEDVREAYSGRTIGIYLKKMFRGIKKVSIDLIANQNAREKLLKLTGAYFLQLKLTPHILDIISENVEGMQGIVNATPAGLREAVSNAGIIEIGWRINAKQSVSSNYFRRLGQSILNAIESLNLRERISPRESIVIKGIDSDDFPTEVNLFNSLLYIRETNVRRDTRTGGVDRDHMYSLLQRAIDQYQNLIEEAINILLGIN